MLLLFFLITFNYAQPFESPMSTQMIENINRNIILENDKLSQENIDDIEKALFSDIKNSLFNVIYSELKTQTLKIQQEVKNTDLYILFNFFQTTYLPDTSVLAFLEYILKILDGWSQNSISLFKANLKEILVKDYQTNFYSKIINKSLENDVLIKLYADFLQNLLEESSKIVFFELVLEIEKSFRNINNVLKAEKTIMQSIKNVDRKEPLTKLALLYKKIYYKFLFEMNSEFYRKKESILKEIAKKSFIEI